MSVIATPGSAGGPHVDEGAQRHRHDAAARGLPEGARRCGTLVVKSTTTVYGASSRDPAMFTEDMEPPSGCPRSGYAKDVAEVEGYVRGFARRRPDVRGHACCASPTSSGRSVSSPITSYFRLPVIPTVLGFDPRLQFLHEQRPARRAPARDAQRRRRHLQRRRRRRPDALPGDPPARPAVGAAARRSRSAAFGSVLRQARLADFSPEQVGFLTYGRGVDTTRMRADARLRAGVHDRRGVRRLRRRARAPAGARPDRRRVARPGAGRRRPAACPEVARRG